ncbi:amidohydrolase [Aminipila sp.]|uniref:amidohydrolase n=1 Tax=Aminipila sp. TaxID=2060095 RepID=UPI00289C9BD5|nr:amidohydrolase [Aminipila sp.]
MNADIILKNGKIYSVSENDDISRGAAIAITKGTITAVGGNQDIQKYAGPDTKVIDCKGNTILPGLCDDHCHASWTASAIMGCNLFHVYVGEEYKTCQAVIDEYMLRLSKYIVEHPDEVIIRGAGWNLSNFNGASGEKRMPTRHDIDKICSNKPVILESFCQHNIWINTKALQIAGLDETTPDTETGAILREEDNYPVGVFQEMESINLIKRQVPEYDFSVDQYKQVIRYYQKNLANNYGVTMINDAMHTDNATAAYRELDEAGELTMRVRGVYTLDYKNHQETIKNIILAKGSDNRGKLFKRNTIKIFLEGEMSTCEPYDENIIKTCGLTQGYNGRLFWDDNELICCMREIIKAGMQIHIHAMGDLSVKQAVECLCKAQEGAETQQRNVIAHLMLVRDEDVKKMAKANIVGSCQPRWMVYDTDVQEYYIPFLGEKRALTVFPCKKLLDAGCIVAFGTDFPVTPPPNPYHEIQCALTRSVFKDAPDYERFKGKVLAPKEKVELKDAMKSLTWSGAYQNWLEDVTGTIEVGKSAELVLLDCDLENIPVDEIYKLKVKSTIFQGRIVYEG